MGFLDRNGIVKTVSTDPALLAYLFCVGLSGKLVFLAFWNARWKEQFRIRTSTRCETLPFIGYFKHSTPPSGLTLGQGSNGSGWFTKGQDL